MSLREILRVLMLKGIRISLLMPEEVLISEIKSEAVCRLMLSGIEMGLSTIIHYSRPF